MISSQFMIMFVVLPERKTIQSIMPTYKLYYFKLRGRAEAARMLFKLAGVDFEDIRLDQKTEWPEFKNSECGRTSNRPI